MLVEDNKKLWFHRRLVAYLLLFCSIGAMVFAYIAPPEKMQYIKEIFWIFITGCLLYIIIYAILATFHDANLLPKILDVLKKK
jgi:biotin transporter BioY